MKKFVLLTRTDDGRIICYRGEGTPNQIRKDVKHFKDPGDLEIYPVIGGRFQRESLMAGCILGFGVGIIIWKSYAYLYQKLRKPGRISASS